MLGFNLHVYKDLAMLSLDSSGDSLHKRGYRPIQMSRRSTRLWRRPSSSAPAGEGTAALSIRCVARERWPSRRAWLALDRPPGLTRKRFGFMGWMDFDIRLWTDIRDEARDGVSRTLTDVYGYDARTDAVAMAGDNARAAGIGNLVRFARGDVRNLKLPEGPPGVIVCNPPYGERVRIANMGANHAAVPRLIPPVLRRRLTGATSSRSAPSAPA